MANYELFGNEKLVPLALAGDAAALSELNQRGNVLGEDGKLRKRTKAPVLNQVTGKREEDDVVVSDGGVELRGDAARAWLPIQQRTAAQFAAAATAPTAPSAPSVP